MKSWHETLGQMQALTDDTEVFLSACQLARELGFDYLAFATATDFTGTTTHMEAISNMPAGWCKVYRRKGYVHIDPTIRHCLESVVPMLWADPTFACFPQLHKDACEHGVRHGVSLAVHDTCGQVSMVSLIRRERVLGADEFCLKAGQCLLLVNMLHQRLGGHLFNALDSSPSHLSSRELEMLRWSAQGKTAGDIGAILSLSERTVNFHINNAVKKLGMNNKISAVVHVAQTGML